MSLVKDLENKKYDKRLLDWSLRNKKISQEEYNQMLNSLEDRASRAIEIDLTLINDDDDFSESEKAREASAPIGGDEGYSIQ